MTIHVALEHRSIYRFDRPVTIGPHVIRLRPAVHARTPILAYSLTVEPTDHFINWQQDPFGNEQARLVFTERATELLVTVDLVADLVVQNPFDYFVEEYAERYPFAYDQQLARDLVPYLAIEPTEIPALDAWLTAAGEPISDRDGPVPINDFLVALNQAVAADVGYTIRFEPGVQSPTETLDKRRGSCRDSSWLLVGLLRRLGLAARFVSGYLVQLRADEQALDGPSGPESDFTDLHAWAEVFIPGAGWLGLDPTSGLFAAEGHIPLACTPEPASAAPITGVTSVCEVEFEYSNTVTRLAESPRVTLPYRDEQWAAIHALGHEVDRRLVEGDVRLSQGGEPTFVSLDDRVAPEWTTDADGPTKRRIAVDLFDRLLSRFATGPVIHHGQGKWYPGEELPRWQMAGYWRTDGQPVWSDPFRLADPTTPGPYVAADATRLARTLAVELGGTVDDLLPAFEDAAYEAWQLERDGRPPSAVSTNPVGWVLPLSWGDRSDRWVTSRWTFRRGRLCLVPGDSPLGLRLPLSDIDGLVPPARAEDPAEAEADDDDDHDHDAEARRLQTLVDRSPFALQGPLPAVVPTALAPPVAATTPPTVPAPRPSIDRRSSRQLPPTALSVEERDGHVYVFLPPLTGLEHFVDLVAAVEAAAAAGDIAIVIEGYPPPTDPRLRALAVTPDPGVIEVNVHPTGSWDELVELTTTLYDDARQCRLSTERFDLDGRHTGTGGGYHVTFGGPTAPDSPLLRRPDLLRSLVTYFQHHPSLSYLFSGRFIGATSQAPRADEARDSAMYELDLAFAELDRQVDRFDGQPPPWLIDRILRNLLVDVTGNTHRAEFCIDKLFSPGSERGRLGLVELRGFEMPPHPRMALVQTLLLRALIARFWVDPYRQPLVRWGTELHDRFLLPHAVTTDIEEVVADLADHGLAFDPAWLAPFVEFRFPRIGAVSLGDLHLDLRAAIEPWDVLGEEMTGGGTSRYVDSSVERVEVEVSGLTPSRHAITCNGVGVPLHRIGADRAVAGVRYKAWAPPSALHPTIEPHVPLVFDVVDLWNGRAIGGCSYHVSHPGGRAYETFPVNASEAEARRASRFFTHGHTPGRLTDAELTAITSSSPDPEYPWTLDLRRHRDR